MRYISTRGKTPPISFSRAVMMGMADDGGLLLPEEIPDISARLDEWHSLSYIELAKKVMGCYTDLSEGTLSLLVEQSYSTFRNREITPVAQVGDLNILELFHGPTLAFKDVALQFLGNLFGHLLSGSGECLNILAATSGDTGSAAIHGVRGKDRISIFVMHPHNRTSKIQELQMTTVLDKNVHNIAIQGTFDDCQAIMKTIFGDLEFKAAHSLGTVNSINWARIVAQVVYYFYSAFRVMDRTGASKVRFSVPTGNFGDMFAGYLAYRMGLPIGKLILATNENDILARFFNTGEYSLSDVHATISPSMDIQVASNFERYLYYLIGEDSERLSGMMSEFAETGRLEVFEFRGKSVPGIFSAGSGDTAGTLDTIRRLLAEHEYLVDPHTAVGVQVGNQHLDPAEPMICLATAHPSKFSKAILDATGKDLAHHPVIDGLANLPSRCDVLPGSVDEVRMYLDSLAED